MARKITIKFDMSAAKELFDDLDELDKTSLEYGIFNEAGNYSHSDPTQPKANILAIHELQSPTSRTPRRDPLAKSVKEVIPKQVGKIEKGIVDFLTGKTKDSKKVFKPVVKPIKEGVKSYFGNPAKLKSNKNPTRDKRNPDRKGINSPLDDFGELKDAIDVKIKKGGD